MNNPEYEKYLINVHESKKLDKAFGNSKPLVKDEVYDKLYFDIKEFEKNNPTLISKDSTTQVIMKDNLSSKDIKHKKRMLSLDKEYDIDNLINFFFKITTFLKIKDEDLQILAELKIDGVAIAIYYEFGVFKYASSRGDGHTGKDITNLIKLVDNVPKKIKELKEEKSFEVYGELYLDSDKIPEAEYKALLEKYSDKRNAISGLSRSIINPDPLIKYASFIAFSYIGVKNKPKDKIIEEYLVLKSLRFHTQLDHMFFLFKNKAHFFRNPINLFTTKRKHFTFDIDGVVFKINNILFHNKLGETNHHPKWALAYKFVPKKATSKLLSVEWNVTETNLIQPVGIVEPVKIDNIVMTRINLYNSGIIKELNLKINSVVEIERRGDVVPKISKVIENNKSTKDIILPTVCPTCKKGLYSRGNGILFCKQKH
jgi:DNA ligase (NAD+)